MVNARYPPQEFAASNDNELRVKGLAATRSLDWRAVISSLAAGYVAGSCGLIVGHPLDSLKVLIQTQSSADNSYSKNLGKARTTASLFQNRSIASLYAGIGAPLLTIGVLRAGTFALYDSFRRILENRRAQDSLQHDSPSTSLINVAIASFAASSIMGVVTSPLHVVKTKQQVMPQWSVTTTAMNTYQQGGARNFYVGFGPHLFCSGFGWMLYLTSFEYFKRTVSTRNHSNGQALDYGQVQSSAGTINVSLPERMICAVLAGQLCWTVIFPADVIRNKIYASAARNHQVQVTATTIVKDLWKHGGFYRGYGITILRAGPLSATVLPVYDIYRCSGSETSCCPHKVACNFKQCVPVPYVLSNAKYVYLVERKHFTYGRARGSTQYDY